MAPPVERPGWMQEPWSMLWDKIEPCTNVGPEPWRDKDPMGVLKFWGEFIETPHT